MELLQKDEATGATIAKCRAAIWAGTFARLGAAFYAATGTRLASDMKVMVRVSANFHSAYGLTLVITDINPEYTAGDMVRRRNQIIAQLRAEGVYDLNRSLPWCAVPCRVAVISAKGAAGFGDFMRHLYANPRRLRFDVDLYTAVLQGESTAPSIIAALEAIMARVDHYDCVVIIRGGGAVSDLVSFDNYDLAAAVAQFPLPVIVGIGHQRDINVLDYVANTSVKTPTAAAEALLGRVAAALDRVVDLGLAIEKQVRAIVSGQKQQLAYSLGTLPALVQGVIARERRRVGTDMVHSIANAATTALARAADRLRAADAVLDVLSPEATLRRGFSITRYDGHAIKDATALPSGAEITTQLATGQLISVVKQHS